VSHFKNENRKTHTYEIAEKPPQQQFEGNITLSAVIKPYDSGSQNVRLSPSSSSQIAMMSCHDYPLTAPAPNGGVDNKYSSTQNHYTLSAS
jgi:hypothetical protein